MPQIITLDEPCEHCGCEQAKLYVDRENPSLPVYAQCLGCRRTIRKIVASPGLQGAPR